MKRREFIAGLGSATAWPVVARAQQPAMPVIGYLGGNKNNPYPAAFRKGLSEVGYVEGQNVAIEYRWREGRNDRLPALISDLVGRGVAVIASVERLCGGREVGEVASLNRDRKSTRLNSSHLKLSRMPSSA